MPLDPSLRSRLRDALRRSAVRPPAPPADPSGSPACPEFLHEGADVAKREGATASGGEAASRSDIEQADRSEGESHESADVTVHELRYEFEERSGDRVDSEQANWIADMLGGWWQRDEAGVCLVVDRTFPARFRHGDAPIRDYAEALTLNRSALSRLDLRHSPINRFTLFAEPGTAAPGSAATAVPDDDGRLLFFDLETTGLSGGAGICAFLIGFGWFEQGSFRTRQYFLSGFGHEPALLRMAAQTVTGVTLVTFNGKAFDVPLIDGRYLFHRVASPFEAVPHIDLLHPARRLWRHRPSGLPHSMDQDRRDAFARYFRMTRAELRPQPRGIRNQSASAASCALGALEETVLGFRRSDDVPGADIAARFFHYVRSGDVRPLEPVLEHNRFDLVSLAALSAVVARMLEEGASAARNAHECLALGDLFERSGSGARAVACYQRATEGPGQGWQTDSIVEREALRRLAVRHRRERQFDQAAAAWQRLLDLPSPQAGLDFEALHALAVHHEHRSRNLQAAHALVVRAIGRTKDPRLCEALRHRLARIDRKLGSQ